ncbi:MAG: rhodanese-like domain-containing protein [Desulfobacterales bacterium]|nr:rhodanese-like domain-containing protein [Desulfobacterales bacterium]
MRKKLWLFMIVIFMLMIWLPVSLAKTSLPPQKQTVLGLYLTASEAYQMWQADQNKVKILDVRTPEEYVFVGHPPMAHNIPFQLFNYLMAVQNKEPLMIANPNFIQEVGQRFKTSDTILVICRSGNRSAAAVNAMAAAGFKIAYSVTEGFEGDRVKDPASSFYGKRYKNGWKNSGLPWTDQLNPQLIWIPSNL